MSVNLSLNLSELEQDWKWYWRRAIYKALTKGKFDNIIRWYNSQRNIKYPEISSVEISRGDVINVFNNEEVSSEVQEWVRDFILFFISEVNFILNWAATQKGSRSLQLTTSSLWKDAQTIARAINSFVSHVLSNLDSQWCESTRKERLDGVDFALWEEWLDTRELVTNFTWLDKVSQISFLRRIYMDITWEELWTPPHVLLRKLLSIIPKNIAADLEIWFIDDLNFESLFQDGESCIKEQWQAIELLAPLHYLRLLRNIQGWYEVDSKDTYVLPFYQTWITKSNQATYSDLSEWLWSSESLEEQTRYFQWLPISERLSFFKAVWDIFAIGFQYTLKDFTELINSWLKWLWQEITEKRLRSLLENQEISRRNYINTIRLILISINNLFVLNWIYWSFHERVIDRSSTASLVASHIPDDWVSQWSVIISDWLVIDCSVDDDRLITRFIWFSERDWSSLCDYLYDKIWRQQEWVDKEEIVARFLFSRYHAKDRDLLSWTKKLTRLQAKRIDLVRFRKTLLGVDSWTVTIERVERPSSIWAWVVDHNISLNWSSLDFWDEVSLDLSSDESAIDWIIWLSAKNVQRLFSYLENLVQSDWKTASSVLLARILQVSSERYSNVYQKIIKLNTEASKITRKFLTNNINITNLRKLLLWELGSEVDVTALLDIESRADTIWKWDWALTDTGETYDLETANIWPEKKKTRERVSRSLSIEFSFTRGGNRVTLKVTLDRRKDMECFIASLNSLVALESKRQGVSGYVRELVVADFDGIDLDTAFFDNVARLRSGTDITDIFDIIDQEVLKSFLFFWANEAWFKLKKPKRVYVESGSFEEVLDFADFLREKIKSRLKKEIRKSSTTRAWHEVRRRKSVEITPNMFEWAWSLTLDLFERLPADKFRGILSRFSKTELKWFIQEYLSMRRAT